MRIEKLKKLKKKCTKIEWNVLADPQKPEGTEFSFGMLFEIYDFKKKNNLNKSA